MDGIELYDRLPISRVGTALQRISGARGQSIRRQRNALVLTSLIASYAVMFVGLEREFKLILCMVSFASTIALFRLARRAIIAECDQNGEYRDFVSKLIAGPSQVT